MKRIATRAAFVLAFLMGGSAVVPGTGAANPAPIGTADRVVVVPKGGPATPITDFSARRQSPASPPTAASVGWNALGLTVSFDCTDSNVVSQARPPDDDNMWRDDAVEIFLDPGHTHDFRSPWIHILLSEAGAVYDERGPGLVAQSGELQGGDRGYSVRNLKSSVTRTADGWRAELLISWEDIGMHPAVGDVWGMNLTRCDQPAEIYSHWAPVESFLQISRWGHVVFADEKGQSGQALMNLEKKHAAINAGFAERQELVDRVTRGEGFMPWQARDISSEEEQAFRKAVEQRKDQMLAHRIQVRHPVLFNPDQWAQARRNIEETAWGKAWFTEILKMADHVVAQPEGYIERMIPELTPTSSYGFTCPNCVGTRSQVGMGHGMVAWDHRTPDVICCKTCGQVYPDARFPETGVLSCPRRGQTISYYRNEAERAHPDDRSGAHAWKWVGRPIHVSFDGIIRQKKIVFMMAASRTSGLAYQLTGDPRYARRAADILKRLARCVPNWLYHDYWDTFADCDPLYAAWHSNALRLEWKRNPNGSAYGEIYEPVAADSGGIRGRMLRDYWGAGRVEAADAYLIERFCAAYDLIYDAKDQDGIDLWTPAERSRIEKDLILEYIIGAEPFVGGPGKAVNISNKAPFVYAPMAMVGRCLGLAEYIDVALRGYEALRDDSFISDGFSHESPAYTLMFLRGIIKVPEALTGFRWPSGFPGRSGTVNPYRDDPKLGLILRSAILDGLRPNGKYLPLSDTDITGAPGPDVFEIGLNRYPRIFAGALPSIYRAQRDETNTNAVPSNSVKPGEYAVFNLTDKTLNEDQLRLPEIYFPAWQTAILRHGDGPDAAVLALPFNPPGNHRHRDNLALFYAERGQTLLGEMGYVSDSVMRGWGTSTLSHNLVVVDDQEQAFAGSLIRSSRLRLMATSPRVSVVEGESRAYAQCGEYRRLVALVKGPGAQTFAVDIFRVRGGNRHAFRVFSELASSDAPDGALSGHGIDLPPGPPLPNFGGSINNEHIFGLRDVRTVENPPDSWQATWSQKDRSYRLHLLSKADAVSASHGPGQETPRQVGRRVRYLDAINQGKDLRSCFVAIHEPSGPDGVMPIKHAERLPVPENAGPDAVALRIESHWGTYLVLSEFDTETQVAGVTFQGKFGVLQATTDGTRCLFSCGASTLMADSFGFTDVPAMWAGRIQRQTANELVTDTALPSGWPETPARVTQYVLVGPTGYPVKGVAGEHISVERFPLMPATDFSLFSTQYRNE
jgi:hypothetical protein